MAIAYLVALLMVLIDQIIKKWTTTVLKHNDKDHYCHNQFKGDERAQQSPDITPVHGHEPDRNDIGPQRSEKDKIGNIGEQEIVFAESVRRESGGEPR